MNWADPTDRERRITETLEWERRELAPLEEIARAKADPEPEPSFIRSLLAGRWL